MTAKSKKSNNGRQNLRISPGAAGSMIVDPVVAMTADPVMDPVMDPGVVMTVDPGVAMTVDPEGVMVVVEAGVMLPVRIAVLNAEMIAGNLFLVLVSGLEYFKGIYVH